jgi:hypothetical protein
MFNCAPYDSVTSINVSSYEGVHGRVFAVK